MEFVPPETFLWLGSTLMPNLNRGQSEVRRNRRFRSFFGTSVDTCADLWYLCYDTFHSSTMPMYLLWALMFMKQYNTEEANASIAGCHEDTFRDWVWYVISVIHNVQYMSKPLDNYLH